MCRGDCAAVGTGRWRGWQTVGLPADGRGPVHSGRVSAAVACLLLAVRSGSLRLSSGGRGHLGPGVRKTGGKLKRGPLVRRRALHQGCRAMDLPLPGGRPARPGHRRPSVTAARPGHRPSLLHRGAAHRRIRSRLSSEPRIPAQFLLFAHGADAVEAHALAAQREVKRLHSGLRRIRGRRVRSDG